MQQGGYGGIYVPKLSEVNKFLIILSAASFLFQSILKLSMGLTLETYLGLSLSGLLSGHIYQVFSYPLVHQGLFGVLFDCLVLWFFGCELEQRWGKKFYLSFLGVSVLGGALLYILVSFFFFKGTTLALIPLMGLKGICFSILLAYGIIFSDNLIPFMLIFPMKAKYFCMILVGIELYSAIFSAYGKVSWGHLGAMGLAYLFLWYTSMRVRKKRFNLQYKFGEAPKKSRSSHLRLVEEEKKETGESDPNNPKYWQ